MGQELRARVLLELRDRLRGPAAKARDRLREISGTARTLRKDMRGASAGSDSLGRSMKSTARETLKAAQSQNRLINEFRNLKSQSQSLKQRLAETQGKLSALAKEGKTTGAEFSQLRRKASHLKKELGQQNERLEMARRRLKGADVATDGLASAQRSARSSIRSTTSALEAQTRELKRTERRLQALDRLTEKRRAQRDRMAGIGLGMGAAGIGTMYAGSQAARPVKHSAIEYGSFEEQMDAVAAIARVSQNSKTYGDLSGKARELGGSTSFSAQEVASAMQFQAMAGFSPDAILASIEDVLDLAKATNTDLAATSDISSNILSAFGMDPSEMGRISDVLTATTTRANVDLSMLGESMKYVAPEAKALGISLEETAAMAGLLGNMGIQGSQAGTALRAIYQRLAAPTSEGAKALKKIGIEARDAQGNLRSVPELLLEIGEATKDMGSAERKEIFKDLIGMEAGSAFSALLDEKGFAAFQQLLEALGDVEGEANRVATEMGDNLPGDLKAFNSAASEVSLTLGEALNPALRETTQLLTGLARDTAAWMKEHPRLTKWIGFTAIAIAGLLVVGGALLTFLGTAMLWSAGLKYGLFMLGASAVRSGGALALLGKVFKGLTGLKPLKWAMFIPKLIWRGFVSAFRWGAYITKLSWRGLVSVLRWLSFIPKIAWRAFLPALKWTSLLGKLSWTMLITPLKWGARLIPGIGWALLAGQLLWSLLIKPLGWDEYIPEFSWPEFEVLDWSTWVPEVNLSEKGRQAIQSLWDGAVEKFDQFIEFIKSIPSTIISKIGSIDLSNIITWPSPPAFLGRWLGTGSDAAADIPGHANGGTVKRTGPIMVGERGPELRYGSKGEFIAHNRQLRQMASLAKAGRRLAAGTVAAASMTGAVAAEQAPPLLPQIAAHGGSTGGTASASGTSGQTINYNSFEITIRIEGGGSSEAQGRKAADAFVRQLNKRLTD
jgi:TP901 family phage tail tape measure protein